MTLTMRGPHQARVAVASYLEAVFSKVLQGLRNEWRLTVEELPDPVQYLPHEPTTLDRWPTIAVVTDVEVVTRRVEHTAEGGEYETTYPMEVYSWVNTTGQVACLEQRDNMATAVRIALLAGVTLGRREKDMVVNEATFRQSFSDIQPVKGERFVAGSYSGFDLLATEQLGNFGGHQSRIVQSVILRSRSAGYEDAGPVPLHPALD